MKIAIMFMTDFNINSAVLYRAGIGWFLAEGRSDEDSIYFPVPGKDLDDFLKTSMISVEDGSGFKNLSFDTVEKENLFEGDAVFTGMLQLLRGSECDIYLEAETISGKILGYQEMDEKKSTIIVSVLSKSGIVNLDPYKIKKILPKNESIQVKLQEFLAGLADSDQKDHKMLRIRLQDNNDQHVYVQFLASVPAWKLSYRLILQDDSAIFQIFAILDNTTLVDFVDAKLTLSTKLPVSFQYDLSSPHFIRRQRIERKTETGIMVEQKSASRSRGGGMRKAKPAPAMAMAEEAFGLADEGLSSMFDQQQFEDQAEVEASESVEFVLKNPVTIRKNESSMVPLTSIDVKSKNKHYYKKPNHKRHPFRIIEFTNDEEYSIDEGPVTVIDRRNSIPKYQGEAILGRIPSGEDGLILYALDRDIDIRHSESNRVEYVGFSIPGYYYRRKKINYRTYKFEITNGSREDISIYFAIRKSGYTFTEKYNVTDSYDEYRILEDVKSQTTEIFEYEEKYEDYTSEKLVNYNISDLTKFIEELDLAEDEKERISKVIEFKKKQKKFDEELKVKNKKLQRLSTRRDQIISSLDVLEEGTSDQTVRKEYVTTLTEVDKELNQLTIEIEDLEEKIKKHKDQTFV